MTKVNGMKIGEEITQEVLIEVHLRTLSGTQQKHSIMQNRPSRCHYHVSYVGILAFPAIAFQSGCINVDRVYLTQRLDHLGVDQAPLLWGHALQ